MKKFIFTLLITFYGICLYSQSSGWTKDDRNNIYDECMSYITKYRNTTVSQRESLALCYLDEVTTKYTKADFEAKIDVELKRIKDALITQCSKNLGIDLTIDQVKQEPVIEKKEIATPKNIVSREGLVGKWKTTQNTVIEFKDGGVYLETLASGVQVTGDWFLDDKGVMTINTEYHYKSTFNKDKVDRYTNIYNFDSFSNDYIKYTKEGVATTIQANRIK